MEVPVPAHSSSLEAPTVKVRNCTSPISWRSCFSDQRLAIASTRILRATDFRLIFCKVRTPPNSSPLGHNGGKHSQPPSPRRSDAPLLAREATPHNPSTKSPSALLKKSSGGKELVSTSPNSKAEARYWLGPRLAKAPSVQPPRKKHKHQPLSQVQVEEDKARKQAEGKERIAMAEANGFRLSKRSKKNPDELQHVLKLNLCSKYGDLHGALEIYDRVHTGGVFKFKQHQYNMLLYICSGAASGNLGKAKSGKVSATADTLETITQSMKDSEGAVEEAEVGEDGKDLNVASFSPEEMQLAARRGTEIYEDMLRAKISPNEATFTAVARLAVAKGDGDLAFETVKKMAVAGMVPKLRTYGPALLCFCEHNEIEKAFEVDDHMVAAGVLPDENLLEALLRLSIAAGLEAKVYVLLQRLRKTVRDVSPLTLTTIERWFNSEAAASVNSLKFDNRPSEDDIRKAAESRGGGWHGLGWLGDGKWVTKRTTISKSGVCQSCGETLCTVDLDPEETEKFANSVAKIAMQRERNPNEFVIFQQWLGKNGPFEAVIDGANIGMYNSALRGFNFNQASLVLFINSGPGPYSAEHLDVESESWHLPTLLKSDPNFSAAPMALGEGQSNPFTSGDAGGDHNEDYGNEYGPHLPTQEELREMEHRRLVGEATTMILNFAKDPKLAKYMTETAFQDVHAQWKATTTSPLKHDTKKQYAKKELEEEGEARLAQIFDAHKKGKKRRKSTDFPGYLGRVIEGDNNVFKRGQELVVVGAQLLKLGEGDGFLASQECEEENENENEKVEWLVGVS
ncbi:hypothetical protein L7F22_064519 [Adiantum nelumboides]|nr:hypothetical protein [Adiantum nelumboides]